MSRCQVACGNCSVNVIGAVLIDSRGYQAASVLERLILLKLIPCDSIALSLCSKDDLSKLLSLNGHQDPRSMFAA